MGAANLELVVIAACAWLAFVAFLSCSSSVSPYVLFFLLVCKSQLFTMHYCVTYFRRLLLAFPTRCKWLENLCVVRACGWVGTGTATCFELMIWVEARQKGRQSGPAGVLQRAVQRSETKNSEESIIEIAKGSNLAS